MLDHPLRAPDHHTVAPFQSPDATAGPDVHIMNALGLQCFGATHVVFVVRVSAVNNYIPCLHALFQRHNGLFCRVARRHHDPRNARLVQCADELVEGRRASSPFTG